MSCKGGPTACKSNQIQQIFRSRRSLCAIRGRSHSDCGIIGGSSNSTQSSLLSAPQDKGNKAEKKKNGIEKCEWEKSEAECAYKTCSVVGDQAKAVSGNSTSRRIVDGTIEKTPDVETVASIEKWLKTRTESVSSMDLDVIKSEVEESVDKYFNEELPHGFLEKDPDALSIDVDLSDKKLILGYDPILQELQSDKLLDSCEKDDEFILPEFQLDHLDPLTLSPDEMMVAGEILPSTSSQHSTNSNGGIASESLNGIEHVAEILVNDAKHFCEKTTAEVQIVDTLRKCLKNNCDNNNVQCQIESDIVISTSGTANIHDGTIFPKIMVENVQNTVVQVTSEASLLEQLKSKSKAKIKLEPRIIKKRKHVSTKSERIVEKRQGDNFADCKDELMTVVAISTDKISNMTQIVINTGTEEQVYQGKTSELLEATGNFPKLPKLENASTWTSTVEYNIDSASNNHHEMVISNALEELGVTDENLQSSSTSEHGKIWFCPQEECNKQFTRLYALKGHLLAHYGVRPFKCDVENCTWAFYSEFKLKRHKETHLKRKDYVCEVSGCNRRFTTVYNLWSHKKLHSRPNRIFCQVPNCQEKFQTKRALELHMKSHDQSHAPYICKHDGCGKRYYSSNALTSHQRCHSYKEIDVKCSWPGCGKMFDKPCRLKAHVRSHTGCKPYLCTYQGCQWAFSSSSKLKRHQKKHTNERKFVCDIVTCGKAFMRSEHLKEHRLTHKEGRFFQCYVCNARFSAKSSLYVHIKKHQTREAVDSNLHESFSSKKHSLTSQHFQCSRVNPITKLKKKSLSLYSHSDGEANVGGGQCNVNRNNVNFNNTTNDENDCDNVCNVDNIDNVDIIFHQDQLRPGYYCPIEACTQSCISKAILRAHMLKVHGTLIDYYDKSLHDKDSTISVPNTDYVLCTTPSVTAESKEQMIMVAPCDAVILSTSPRSDRILPEPEPPPTALTITTRNSESSHNNNVTHETSTEQQCKKDQGSARTGLTFSDVWKLKENGMLLDSAINTPDFVFGSSDMGEGLLLTEELPSMYYQDDGVGTEYQVLLLDSGPPENTIN